MQQTLQIRVDFQHEDAYQVRIMVPDQYDTDAIEALREIAWDRAWVSDDLFNEK